MELYFSHSKHDYNTEYERAAERVINYITGNKYTILNPRDVTPETIEDVLSSFEDDEYIENIQYIRYQREMYNVFFPLIDKSQAFACIPDNITGKYSSGVQIEIQHAKKRKKIFIEIPHLDKYIIEGLGWSNEFTL